MFWQKKRAQPKTDHPSLYPDTPLNRNGYQPAIQPDLDTVFPLKYRSPVVSHVRAYEEKLTFSPSDNLGLHLPPMSKAPATYTAQDVAAIREYIKRSIRGNMIIHHTIDRVELWFCKSLSQLAKDAGLSFDELVEHANVDEQLKDRRP